MSFMEVKPTPEYLEENGVEPYFKVWSSVHEGWIYREKATDNQVSRGTYTTKEALLEHGTVEVWDQTNQQRSDEMSVSISEALSSAGYEPVTNLSDARWLLGQMDNMSELFEQAEACIELSEAEQALSDAKDDGDADEIAYYQRQLELTKEIYKR